MRRGFDEEATACLGVSTALFSSSADILLPRQCCLRYRLSTNTRPGRTEIMIYVIGICNTWQISLPASPRPSLRRLLKIAMAPPPSLSPSSTYLTLNLGPPALDKAGSDTQAPATFALPSPLPKLTLVSRVGELPDEFIYEVGTGLAPTSWLNERSNVLAALKEVEGVKGVREMALAQRTKRGGEF